MSKFSIAKEDRTWYGFHVPKGAIYGKLTALALSGESRVYDFVYLGKARRIKRPDGTLAGWQVYVFVSHHKDARLSENPYDGDFTGRWFDCTKGSLYRDMLNKHIRIERPNKELIEGGQRNIFAYVPKPHTKGAIYNMVRERQ